MAEQLVVFDSNLMPWQPHPTVPDLMLKIFGRRNGASLHAILVKVLTESKIDWHSRANTNETIHVIRGVEEIFEAIDERHHAGAGQTKLTGGSVVTIQVALNHAVYNTASDLLLIFAFHSPATV